VTAEKRRLLGAVVNLGVFGALLWLSLPHRPPVAPYVWRSAARVAQAVADDAGTFALWCRSRYWRAVRP
jgi:hypothetical protein